MNQPPQTKRATAAPDYIAPDGSEIRTLPATERGSMAHCTLPVGVTTKAVAHRTVEEFWYFLEGEGEVWRDTSDPPVTPVSAGVSLTIPTGTQFQFRNTGTTPLRFVIVTIPPWSGADEAYRVADFWSPTA